MPPVISRGSYHRDPFPLVFDPGCIDKSFARRFSRVANMVGGGCGNNTTHPGGPIYTEKLSPRILASNTDPKYEFLRVDWHRSRWHMTKGKGLRVLVWGRLAVCRIPLGVVGFHTQSISWAYSSADFEGGLYSQHKSYHAPPHWTSARSRTPRNSLPKHQHLEGSPLESLFYPCLPATTRANQSPIGRNPIPLASTHYISEAAMWLLQSSSPHSD